jgi:hypothetical protein
VAQLSDEALLSHSLTMLTETGLSSGMGIVRGRRRQGRRSPFSVFKPYFVGMTGGFAVIGVTRSLIYCNYSQAMVEF